MQNDQINVDSSVLEARSSYTALYLSAHSRRALGDAYLRIGRIEATMRRPQTGEIVRVPSTNLKQCPVCRGTGKDGRDSPCKACEATGEISTRSTDGIHAPAIQKPECPKAEGQASITARVIGGKE